MLQRKEYVQLTHGEGKNENPELGARRRPHRLRVNTRGN